MALPSVPYPYVSWNSYIELNAPALAAEQGLTLQEAKASLKLLYVSRPVRQAIDTPSYRIYNVFSTWSDRTVSPVSGRPWLQTGPTDGLSIVTESGDLLVTESGDNLITQEFNNKMATTTIANLPALAVMTDSSAIPVDTGTDTFKMSGANLKNYFGSASLISNGTSYANIASTDGNVVISADGSEWTFGTDGSLTFPDSTVQSTAYPGGGYALPVCVINSSTTGSGSGEVSVNFTVTNPSGVAITAIGIFLPSVNTSSAVQLAASAAAGTQSKTLTSLTGYTRYWAQVYAETDNGTAYSAPNYLSVTSICLLAGTMIALADGTYKTIEDITYTDRMLSWDFDLGCYAETKAVWIKQTETGSQYNLLTFSDGTTLRTFDQHRIFNKQAGSFTYPMTDATPIGTITVNEHGQEITLISKEIVVDTIEYYNVITDYHMNLFSDSILTSCRFNNIYPITDMKFVKDTRTLRTRDEFENIPDRFFYGLRLAEQTFDLAMIEWYVNRLLSVEQSVELVAV